MSNADFFLLITNRNNMTDLIAYHIVIRNAVSWYFIKNIAMVRFIKWYDYSNIPLICITYTCCYCSVAKGGNITSLFYWFHVCLTCWIKSQITCSNVFLPTSKKTSPGTLYIFLPIFECCKIQLIWNFFYIWPYYLFKYIVL